MAEIIVDLEVDDEAHAVYIRLTDESVSRSTSCDANIDIDENGNVIGVELLWWPDEVAEAEVVENPEADVAVKAAYEPAVDEALRAVHLLETFVQGRQEALQFNQHEHLQRKKNP